MKSLVFVSLSLLVLSSCSQKITATSSEGTASYNNGTTYSNTGNNTGSANGDITMPGAVRYNSNNASGTTVTSPAASNTQAIKVK